MASGDVVEAWRTRDGEFMLGEESADPDAEWILSVRRLRGIRGSFAWDELGPRVSYWNEDERITVDCYEENGLPYLTWTEFRPLRVLLAKAWKQRGTCVAMRALSLVESELQIWEVKQAEEKYKLRQHCENMSVLSEAKDAGEARAEELCKQDKVNFSEVWDAFRGASVRSQEQASDESVPMWVFGLYVDGNSIGVTTETRRLPWLTNLLTKFVRQHNPELEFLAVRVEANMVFRPHRELGGSQRDTAILGITRFEGGQLWIEGLPGEGSNTALRVVEEDEDPRPGKLYEISHNNVRYNGEGRLIGTEPFRGCRTVAIAYTPDGHQEISGALLDQLCDLGFQDARMKRKLDETDDTPAQTFKAQHIANTNIGMAHDKNGPVPVDPKPQVVQGVGLCGSEQESVFGIRGSDSVRHGSRAQAFEAEGPAPQPHGVMLTEPVGEPDAFYLQAYQHALLQLQKKCSEGCYDKGCPECVRARGAVRPHRSIHDGSKTCANLSLDASGPHLESADKMRYMVVGVYRLPSGKNLYYAESTKSKSAQDVARATVQIMAQLSSLQVPPVYRIHADCGKEFEAQLFMELHTKYPTFHTQSVPYNPQSNGRVERGVQALKQAAIRELLHSGLSPTFWTFAVQNAALYSRMRALGESPPKGTPKMGDWVAVSRPDAQSFEERSQCGVFVGHNVSSVHGAWMLILDHGVLKLKRARLPILLDTPVVRWKTSTDPEGDRRVWVAPEGLRVC